MSDSSEPTNATERTANTDAESGALIFAVIVVAVLAFVGALVGSIVASYAPGYRDAGAATAEPVPSGYDDAPVYMPSEEPIPNPPVPAPVEPEYVPAPPFMGDQPYPGFAPEYPGYPEYPVSPAPEPPMWSEPGMGDAAYYATIANEITAANADINTVISVLDELGVTFRVVAIDGEYLMVTMDYSPSRLNLEIVDGVVVAASVG